jgi:DNA-binding transcriptional MerR regulator
MSRRTPRPNRTESRQIRAIDQLAQYEQFMEEVGPVLTAALKEGWTAEKLYSNPKIEALLAARAIGIALRDPDSGRSLAAIKEALDRSKGKPTEKKELTHKLEKLSDDELDAALVSLRGEVVSGDEE